jgi:diphthine-ammonia ligase
VAFLRIKKASLDPKDVQCLKDVPSPLLLDDDQLCVRDAVLRSQECTSSSKDLSDPLPSPEPDSLNVYSKRLDSWIAVTNIHRELDDSVAEMTIEDEVKQCFQKLQGKSRSE